MYLADFLIAQSIPDPVIRSAFASALSLDLSDVSVWREGQVLDRTTAVIVQTSGINGDFRYQVRVTVHGANAKPDLQEKLLDITRTLARELSTIVVTDDIEFDDAFDDGYLLVAPDGTTEIVREDVDATDSDTIVLMPESRSRYEAIQSASHQVIVSG